MKNPIKSVVHVTSWLSRQGGGIPPVIWALARETNARGINASVICLEDQWLDEDCRNNNFPFSAGKIIGPKNFGFSTELKKQLNAQTQTGEIIHSHGLWMYPGLAARKCVGKNGSPLIVSPHGMLEPWALNHSRWKKRLAGFLFENKNLRKADCLHALCAAEAENFRRYGLKNPITIIPNGVDMDEFVPPTASEWLGENFPETKDRPRVLFLSRLHPKKGLSNLLQAWQQLARDFKDWCLLIAGNGQPAYEQELKTRVKNLELEKNVFFLGPIYGKEKKQVLAASDVFVLPSFSEGFSVAILEAAAAALPVVLTQECNFPELAKAGAAVEISPGVSEIESGLRQIMKLSGSQRKIIGQRGRELVKKSYTWPAIAEEMCKVYQWLAGNAAMPETVKMN